MTRDSLNDEQAPSEALSARLSREGGGVGISGGSRGPTGAQAGSQGVERCRTCGTTQKLHWRGVGSGLPYCTDCEACDCQQNPCMRLGTHDPRVAGPDAIQAVHTPPAEWCGDTIGIPIGQGTVECVLRPGHSGSHADETGMRWRLVEPRPDPRDLELELLRRAANPIDVRMVDEMLDEVRKRIAAEAAVERVRGLHRNDRGLCVECSTEHRGALWPCNTIGAIDPTA